MTLVGLVLISYMVVLLILYAMMLNLYAKVKERDRNSLSNYMFHRDWAFRLETDIQKLRTRLGLTEKNSSDPPLVLQLKTIETGLASTSNRLAFLETQAKEMKYGLDSQIESINNLWKHTQELKQELKKDLNQKQSKRKSSTKSKRGHRGS